MMHPLKDQRGDAGFDGVAKSDVTPDKLFPTAFPLAHPDTMGENNTPTALKGCRVKTQFKN